MALDALRSGGLERLGALLAASHRSLRDDYQVSVPDLDRLVDETLGTFGRIDILINNAASGFNRPALEQKVTGWDWSMHVNARAYLFATQRAAPLMEKRGGGQTILALDDAVSFFQTQDVEIISLNEAMEKLARRCKRRPARAASCRDSCCQPA